MLQNYIEKINPVVKIKDFYYRVKSWFLPREGEIFLVSTIILVALLSFALGRLSSLRGEKFPIQVYRPGDIKLQTANVIQAPAQTVSSGKIGEGIKENLFVASKNSSVYHFPWCSGAQRIKEENKIYFSSREEAEKAGFRPAANCEGL